MTREPDRSDVYRRWAWLFVALIAAGCIVGIAVPAGLGWDFANFYDAGRRVAAGQVTDLYRADSLIAGQLPQGRTGFFGTPISALLYVPLSGLSPETALVVFKIENVLALGLALGILFAFSRTFVPPDRLAQSRFAASFAFLCLLYQPFWTVFRVGGQTTPTVLLFLSLGLVFHTRRRYWGSALCVATAVAIKPALVIALFLLICVSGLAYLRAMVVVLVAFGLASLLLLGWPVHLAFLDYAREGAQSTYSWHYNSSLYILVDNFRAAVGPGAEAGVSKLAFSALTYVIKATSLGTVIYLVVQSRRRPWPAAARRHFHFVLALLLFLWWSLTVWEHYLAVLFLLLIYVVAASSHFSRRALGLVTAIFVLCLGQNLILIDFLRTHVAFDSAWALDGIALFKSGPLVLTMILLWRHYRELFSSYSDPAWERAPFAASVPMKS